jgi:hypothetical protein
METQRELEARTINGLLMLFMRQAALEYEARPAQAVRTAKRVAATRKDTAILRRRYDDV